MYRVKDWLKHYENHETRKLKTLKWVPVPNRHDGAGFRRIAELPDNCEIFTAWILLLEIASKSEIRGNLPALPADAAYKTGFPKIIFEKAYTVLSDKNIDWIESYEESPEISRHFPESPATPGKTAAELNGIEGKGREVIPKNPFLNIAQAELFSPLPNNITVLYEEWKQHLAEKQLPFTQLQAKKTRDHLREIGYDKAKFLIDRAIRAGARSIFVNPEDLKQPTKNSSGRPTAPPLF